MTKTTDPADWLAENIETFNALFDAGGLLAGVVEEDGDDYRYVSVNLPLAAHFGSTQAALVGKTGRDVGASETNIALRMATLDHCHRKGVQREEFWLPVKGARRRYMSTHTAAPAGPNGARRMAFCSADITARKTAEIEAARQQARVEAALDAAAMGIWEYDAVADQLSWDARGAALAGLSGENISLETFIAMVHPEDAPAVVAAQDRAEAGENGGYYRVEHRIMNDQGVRWLESTGRLSFNAKGEVVSAIGTVRDIGPEIVVRERQAFLTAELNHRVKNNLAAVQAIANQTLQWSPDPIAFREAFQARVSALGRAHDLLNANAWTATDLRELMARSLEGAAGVVTLDGPDAPVMILPERAMTLAIIFNELATNAAKHGCHSVPGGAVTLSWVIVGDRVEIRWTERGGPPVKAPKRQGFGSRMLRAGVGGRDGAARLEFDPEGLKVRLTLIRSPAVAFEAAPELV